MSVINTNITALIGQQNLTRSSSALQTSMERLSSGLRINSAKDDAAGQAIANRMSSQITGLIQAQRNANDGISVAQTAEGALNQINDNLQRIRELSVQAQNGTNSSEDLTSIQNEIGQRLEEINRVSAETEFNGVKVLAQDNSLIIQVGANDGQSISIDLQKISAQTLGLDGFNVDGSGTTQNAAATASDLTAAGATGATNVITTTHTAATFEQVLAQMTDGNTVAVDSTVDTTYTYDAASGAFTYGATANATNTTVVAALTDTLTPSSGTATGSYEIAGGDTVSFEVSSAGTVTIGGEAAFITASGALTTNDDGASTAATLEELFVAGGTAAATSSITMGGTAYESDGAGVYSYDATMSAEDVAAEVGAAVTGTLITLGSGITSGTVNFGATSTDSSDTYVDAEGDLTTVASFTTTYAVDADTGAVTVSGGSGTGNYAPEIGAAVYVNIGGDLTTETTSEGEQTEDPLAALDSALTIVDALRSDLGAIQNRFDSAISNLATTTTNLTAARSRIEDADYAVEVSNMTRAQILQQAGTSVLAQANQVPQSVLSLLR